MALGVLGGVTVGVAVAVKECELQLAWPGPDGVGDTLIGAETPHAHVGQQMGEVRAVQDRAVVGMLSGRVGAPRLSGDSANLLAGHAVDADPDVLVGDRAVAEDHTEQPCDVSGDIRPIWKRFDRTCIGGTIEGDEQITDLELIQACPFVAKDGRRSFVDPGVAVDLPPSEVSRAHPTSINSVGAARDRAGGVLAGTVGNTARREPCPRSRLAVCGLPSGLNDPQEQTAAGRNGGPTPGAYPGDLLVFGTPGDNNRACL